MARARNIKPAFFSNELLGTADPMIGLTFIGLWCLADKDGILEDRPLRIKAELFPYREGIDVNGYLTVLARLRFVVRYRVGDSQYIKVLKFGEHQSPHNTEKPRGYPGPEHPNALIIDENCDLTVKEQLSNDEKTEPKRPDSLIPDSLIQTPVVPLPDDRKRRRRLPDDFSLTVERRQAATKYWLAKGRRDLNPEDQFAKFRSHHVGKGTRMLDWDSVWQTWYSNAIEFTRAPAGPQLAEAGGVAQWGK